MKKLFFLFLALAILLTASLCSADIIADNEKLISLLPITDNEEADWVERDHPYGKLVFALFTDLGKLTESSFEAANAGTDFYGIPAGRLARTMDEANTIFIVRKNSVITGWNGFIPVMSINAKVTELDAASGGILSQGYTDADSLPPEGSGIDPCVYYVQFFSEFLGEEEEEYWAEDYTEEEPEWTFEEEGDPDLYNQALGLYADGRYYSAKRAFIESGYGDWEEKAASCEQKWPATGELWHDRSQWLQDMELTFVIDQDFDSAIYIRLFKNNQQVSTVFIGGPGEVTLKLPGNGYYAIQDGIGRTWYGEKEAFGPDGVYEDMTFDERGTDKVYLQSYYEYTLSINVENTTGDVIYSDSKDWENFVSDGN